jgi:hypothetical protein
MPDMNSWTDPSRGVTSDVIDKWMQATPEGKRFAGYAAGSQGAFPAYMPSKREVPGTDPAANTPPPVFGAFSSAPVAAAQPEAVPAMMTGGSAPVQTRQVQLPDGQMMPIAGNAEGAGWGSNKFAQDARDQAAKSKQEMLTNVLGRGYDRKLTVLPKDQRDEAAMRIMDAVKSQLGEPPKASGLGGTQKRAAWEKQRDKIVASAAGQEWWQHKERLESEGTRQTMMKQMYDIQNAAQKTVFEQQKFAADLMHKNMDVDLKIMAEKRARLADKRAADMHDVALAQGKKDLNFVPSTGQVTTPEGENVPFMMTSPRQAQVIQKPAKGLEDINATDLMSERSKLVLSKDVMGQTTPRTNLTPEEMQQVSAIDVAMRKRGLLTSTLDPKNQNHKAVVKNYLDRAKGNVAKARELAAKEGWKFGND